MKFLRDLPGRIFFLYAVLLFVATMLIVIIPIWLISFFPEPTATKFTHKVFKAWMSVYMPLVFCPVIRKGRQNFKKGQPYVVVVNHNSFVDIPVSSPWIPGANKTLAKIEMMKIPLFNVIYKSGSILVDRKKESSRRESFAKMQQTLDMGVHLCLYPEGTRNKTNMPLQPFFDGAFITAIRTQKPIMPGLIFNTGKILPHNKKFWARPMPVKFHFLKPVPTEGLTLSNVAELKEKVHSMMEAYYIAYENKPKA